MQKIKTGDIVKHKLTKERLLILPSTTEMNFSSQAEDIRVRRKNFEIVSVNVIELISIKKEKKYGTKN